MPAMANITIKADNNTTDILWMSVYGSRGDGQWSLHRSSNVAAAVPYSMRPTLRYKVVDNGPKTARKLFVEVIYPDVKLNSATGYYEAKNAYVSKREDTIPQGMDPVALVEAISQASHLHGATFTKDVGKSMTGPW